jgi:hypothetical protein
MGAAAGHRLAAQPLYFEMNRGQFPAEVQFASRGAGQKAFFTQSEMVLVLRKPGATGGQTNPSTFATRTTKEERRASRAVVRMSLTGANAAPDVTGMDELPGKINYFAGAMSRNGSNVPTFRKIHTPRSIPGSTDLLRQE